MALSQAPVERRSAARLTARGFATGGDAGNVQSPTADVPSAGFEFGDATRTDIAIWHQAPVPMSTANPVALVWQGEVALVSQDFGVNNTYPVLRWLWAWRIAFTMLCIGFGLAIILFVR